MVGGQISGSRLYPADFDKDSRRCARLYVYHQLRGQQQAAAEEDGNRSGKFPGSAPSPLPPELPRIAEDRMYKNRNVYTCVHTHIHTSGRRSRRQEKEALGKLLSGVIGSGSYVASCSPSVIPQLSRSPCLSLVSLFLVSPRSCASHVTFGQRGYILACFLLFIPAFQFFQISPR